MSVLQFTRVALGISLLILFLPGQRADGELIFGTPVPVAEPLNNEYGNIWMNLSSDMLTAFIVSDRPGTSGPSDIWASTRDSLSATWPEPVRLGAEINTPAAEAAPSISADGLELYFRRGPQLGDSPDNDGDLYVTRRSSISEPWETAERLPAPINTDQFDENEPSISFDGLELYFDSNRPDDAGQDVFVARRASKSEPFGEPELFERSAGSSFLSSDGLQFFFVTVPGVLPGLGEDDFFVRTRESTLDGFGPPSHIESISSPFEDFGLFLTPDESTVYFSSNRPGVPTGGGLGEWGLWQAPVVPEPSSLVLIVLGLLALLGCGNKKAARKHAN
jgi:hypothetical protein